MYYSMIKSSRLYDVYVKTVGEEIRKISIELNGFYPLGDPFILEGKNLEQGIMVQPYFNLNDPEDAVYMPQANASQSINDNEGQYSSLNMFI